MTTMTETAGITMSKLQYHIPAAPCLDGPDGSAQSSCLAGLYLLTGDATLARFDHEGSLTMEPELSAGLSFRLGAVLGQYRSGAVEKMGLALVMDTNFDRQGDTGAMILSAPLLRELSGRGPSPGNPSARQQQESRTMTIHEGMELLLNEAGDRGPRVPRFCPVLFVPEVDNASLRDRYGVELLDDVVAFEVLDLCAAFTANRHLPGELLTMVTRMRRTQAEARMASPGRWTGTEPAPGGHDAPVLATRAGGSGCTSAADTCFREGDPVTGWLLEWFSPFNELTDTQREIVAGYETLRKAAAGTRLVERGSRDDACIYLVEGVLELEAPDGTRIRVSGGSRRSRLPISVLTPHVYTVDAVTDASIIIFSQKLIRKVTEVTRTYSAVDRMPALESSTTAISNGLQALYLTTTHLRR